MKLYRIVGVARQDQGATREHYSTLAEGVSTRVAADRIVAELASQGAIHISVVAYAEEEGEVTHGA